MKITNLRYLRFSVILLLIIPMLNIGGSTVAMPSSSIKNGDIGIKSADTLEIPWGVNYINAPRVWEHTKGEGIIVAVIDTGIDYNHSDLKDNVWINSGEIKDDGIDNDGNGYIDDWRGYDFVNQDNDPFDDVAVPHGTHVSGTIGAVLNNYGVVGVAPNVTIMPLKVFSADEEGASEDVLAEAINYAVDNGADIISMSLGAIQSGSDQFKLAVKRAYDEGVITVAASGNDGQSRVNYPGYDIHTIGVGAIDSMGKVADFSNYGSGLDIVAPGVAVNSTVRRGSGLAARVFADGTQYDVLPMDFGATSEVTGQLVYVGLGYPDDITENLTGKIAFIKRGILEFKAKVENVVAKGAIGAIIFNNEKGNFLGTLQEQQDIPVVSMSKEDGEALLDILDQKNITSTISVKPSDYMLMDGTSMATPHVSGAVALLLGLNSSLTFEDVRTILRYSADQGKYGNPARYGWGILNASRAMDAVFDNKKPVIKINTPTVKVLNETYIVTTSIIYSDDTGLHDVYFKYDTDVDINDEQSFTIENRAGYYNQTIQFMVNSTISSMNFTASATDIRGHTIDFTLNLTSDDLIDLFPSLSSLLSNTEGAPGFMISQIIAIPIIMYIIRNKKLPRK